MDATVLLLGQIDALGEQVARARTAINSPGIDARLRSLVGARLDTQLGRLANRCAQLRAARGDPAESGWRDLQTLQAECGEVFDECLAFLQGARARQQGVDEGMCAVTDELLDDLARWSDVGWQGFTLLATSEVYRQIARIIRIRYPDVSVWSVPLAAHEFGHYAGPELRRSSNGVFEYPFQERLRRADQQAGGGPHTKEWHHVQEVFADVYATYTLGPAYAAAIVLLRLNPRDAQADSFTHPSAAERVHAVLWTLDRMEQRDAGRPPLGASFRDVTSSLGDTWNAALHAAGGAAPLPDAKAALVANRCAETLDMLADLTPQRLQYRWSDWLRAVAASADLTKSPADGLTRRDVLNAAWLARLQAGDAGPHAVSAIARGALQLYGAVGSPAAAGPAGIS